MALLFDGLGDGRVDFNDDCVGAEVNQFLVDRVRIPADHASLKLPLASPFPRRFARRRGRHLVEAAMAAKSGLVRLGPSAPVFRACCTAGGQGLLSTAHGGRAPHPGGAGAPRISRTRIFCARLGVKTGLLFPAAACLWSQCSRVRAPQELTEGSVESSRDTRPA